MANQSKKPLRVKPYKQPSIKELEKRRGRKLTVEELKRYEDVDALGLKVLELEPGSELTNEEVLSHLAYGLRSVVADAFDGNTSALERLWQIHQLIYPDRYRLSASISRAMSVRRLMADLSRVVVLIRGENFLNNKSFIKLTDDRAWHHDKHYKLAKRQLDARRSNRPMTLQSLAINVYLETVRKNFGSIDQRIIERDLQAARLYDRRQQKLGREPDDNILLASGEYLPFYKFTDSWKQRQKPDTDKKS